ncbi:MAG: hypothetical protein R2856_12370 [Caldilineaceae bacterium]
MHQAIARFNEELHKEDPPAPSTAVAAEPTDTQPVQPPTAQTDAEADGEDKPTT